MEKEYLYSLITMEAEEEGLSQISLPESLVAERHTQWEAAISENSLASFHSGLAEEQISIHVAKFDPCTGCLKNPWHIVKSI